MDAATPAMNFENSTRGPHVSILGKKATFANPNNAEYSVLKLDKELKEGEFIEFLVNDVDENDPTGSVIGLSQYPMTKSFRDEGWSEFSFLNFPNKECRIGTNVCLLRKWYNCTNRENRSGRSSGSQDTIWQRYKPSIFTIIFTETGDRIAIFRRKDEITIFRNRNLIYSWNELKSGFFPTIFMKQGTRSLLFVYFYYSSGTVTLVASSDSKTSFAFSLSEFDITEEEKKQKENEERERAAREAAELTKEVKGEQGYNQEVPRATEDTKSKIIEPTDEEKIQDQKITIETTVAPIKKKEKKV